MLQFLNNKWLNDQYKDKYFSTKFIFFIILILSQFIFAYDEEKVVVLCLISFVIIAYSNINLSVYNALNEKKTDFLLEFLILFKEKIKLMKKLRFYWRIFLDLEDLTIELCSWLKKQINLIVLTKIKNRKNIIKHLLKDKYKRIIQNKLLTQKTLNNLYWKLLMKNLYQNNIVLNNNLQLLKNLNVKYKISHFIFNKLNLNIANKHNNNYITLFFCLFN